MIPWWFWIGLALLAGLITPLQLGLNASLAQRLPFPLQALWVSFLGGFTVASLTLLFTRTPLTPLLQWSWLQQQPWWLFTGGLFGAFFVVASIFSAPRLGATLFVILVVLGQLLGSLWLDNAGALGFAKTAISWQRLAAVGLVMLGVWLVKKY